LFENQNELTYPGDNFRIIKSATRPDPCPGLQIRTLVFSAAKTGKIEVFCRRYVDL